MMLLSLTILLALISLVYSDDEFLPNGLPDHRGMRAGYLNETKIEINFNNSSDINEYLKYDSTSSAVYGVDVSSSISSTAASCLVSSSMSFIIPRGYRSTGSVDTNVCTTLKNAKTAGISTRDVYMFPCPTCSASAASQMSTLVTYLKANCASYWSGRIWLDIEGSSYWIGSTTSNKAWYQNLVDSCSTYSVTCGVYSSSSQWSAIFGSTSYSYGSSLKLWYAHYDNLASFSDFSAFGGWSSPHAKQYVGDATLCSVGVDKNYATSF